MTRKMSIGHIIKQTVADFMEDKALRLAAALAYYAIFSLGPLLVLAVGVAGLLLGEERVRSEVTQQLASLMGDKSSQMIGSMMTANQKSGSLLATVVGGAALLFGASGVFGQLQDALNTIWEVKSKPGQGIWGFLRQRFLSMTMVLGIGFLLLVSMVLTTVLDGFANYIGNLGALSGHLLQGVNLVVSFGAITLLFAAIFKVLPDVEIRWRYVWIGAAGTALLFTLGKYGLALYLTREGTTSAFGAASAFVIIIMYVYYSSLILFLGAEFTQVYARAHGVALKPSKHAEPLTEEKRAQEGMTSGKARPTARETRPVPSGVLSSAANQGSIMKANYSATAKIRPRPTGAVRYAPLERIQARPWSFLVMAASAGVTAGLLWRFKMLRQAVKVVAIARRLL